MSDPTLPEGTSLHFRVLGRVQDGKERLRYKVSGLGSVMCCGDGMLRD